MNSLSWIPGRALAGHILPFSSQARHARRTARLLHDLDDRMLADIGVGRDQIEAVSRAATFRRA
jgi:uncharacterized protein YjiS (DUF1127 family)